MSLLRARTNRRIIPRWRSSDASGLALDLNSLSPRLTYKPTINFHFDEAQRAFAESPTIGSAADYLAAASMERQSESAISAASFILKHATHAPSSLVAQSQSIVNVRDGASAEVVLHAKGDAGLRQLEVSRLRKLVRVNPINPVIWSDLARHYASIGERRQAERCMRTALQLAPNHRWILRTAARFFVHIDAPQEGHAILARHPRTGQDPWLLSAELAVAQVAQKPPKFWKQANEHLRWERSAPAQLSELAVAVAMFELDEGKAKRARRLVETALHAPTENALAQVTWARQFRNLNDANDIRGLAIRDKSAFEARFGILLGAGNLTFAVAEGRKWAFDEPFAARPLAGLAFIAAMLDDHDATIRLTREIIKLDGDAEETLRMNAVFARLSSGGLVRGRDDVEIETLRSQLSAAAEQKSGFHAIANLALWNYRFGDADLGRTLYADALQKIEKGSTLESAALAATFAAREAVLSMQPEAAHLLERAKSLAVKAKSKVALFYVRKLDALIADPSSASRILSPESAREFELPESVTVPT